MRKMHMLDRRWDSIGPGAQADCGADVHGELKRYLTMKIPEVTCKMCKKIYIGWNGKRGGED